MAENTFDVGDQIRLRASFTDVDGAADTPTSTTIEHKDPSGNITTIENGDLTTEATGILYTTIDVDEAGRWYWRATGSASPKAAGEASFIVRPKQSGWTA